MNDPIVVLWSWLAVAPLVPVWLTVTVALATAAMLLEALFLLLWHRRTGRGLPPRSLLPTLAAGGGLMGALLAVLTGASPCGCWACWPWPARPMCWTCGTAGNPARRSTTDRPAGRQAWP